MKWLTLLAVATLATGCFFSGKASIKGDLKNLSSDDSKKSSSRSTTRKSTAKKSNSADERQLTYERNMSKSRMKTRIEGFNNYCPLDKKILPDPGRCKQQIKYAEKVLAGIKEHVKALQEYKDLVALTDKVKKNMPVWEQNLAGQKADQAESRKQSDLFRDLTRQHRIIGALWSYKTSEKFYTTSDAGRLLDTYKKATAMERAFMKKCAEKAFDKVRTFSKPGSSDTPEAVCDVAANWKKYFKIYLNKSLETTEKREAQNVKYAIEQLDEKGFIYDSMMVKLKDPAKHVANLRAKYQKVYDAMGEKMPEELFKTVLEGAKPFKPTLKKASRMSRWDKKARYKDKAVARAFSRTVRDNSVRFIKYGLTHAEYTISKNNIGIPTKKYRSGFVMVKAKDKFCRIYYLTAYAQYAGAGRYAKPLATLKLGDRFMVSKCK